MNILFRFAVWLRSLFDGSVRSVGGSVQRSITTELPLREPEMLCQQCRCSITGEPIIIVFGGKECEIVGELCTECTQQYIDMHATGCAHCGEPILPGCMVAFADRNLDHFSGKYIHLQCADFGGAWCGDWDRNRRFIPLDQLPSGRIVNLNGEPVQFGTKNNESLGL